MFTALIEYLTGLSALTALIPAASIQPVNIRKGVAKPYLTVSRISRTDSQDLGNKSTFAETDTFELDIVTDSVTSGEAVLEVIRKNLDGWPIGNMGTAPVYVNSSRLRNVFNYSEPDDDARDSYSFHTVLVFDFGYSQADNSL